MSTLVAVYTDNGNNYWMVYTDGTGFGGYNSRTFELNRHSFTCTFKSIDDYATYAEKINNLKPGSLKKVATLAEGETLKTHYPELLI